MKKRFASLLRLLVLVGPLSALGACASTVQSVHDPAIASRVETAKILDLPYREQTNQTGCGIAALSSMLAYWDVPGTLAALEQSNPPDTPKGYSLGRLMRIAESQGLKAFAVRLDDAAVKAQIAQGRPILVPMEKAYYGRLFNIFGDMQPFVDHYVVAIGYDDQDFWVMDPDGGIRTVPVADFSKLRNRFNSAALLAAR